MELLYADIAMQKTIEEDQQRYNNINKEQTEQNEQKEKEAWWNNQINNQIKSTNQ